MSSSTDETLHPTERWARAICDTEVLQDRAGRELEDTARARLFGVTMGRADLQDLEGQALADQAFAGLFGAAPPGSSSSPRIGKYVLGASLGRGGMGEVFLATDTQLNRKAAVKLLRAGGPQRPFDHSRLLREAQALAALNHANVVGIYDCGVHDGQVFLAMEYIEGCTLSAWQDAAPRGWRELLRRYLAAGRGLAAIHEAGLVHRDFKPQNVLVAADGRVKIVDFGLAIAPGERTPQAQDSPLLLRAEALSLLATQLTATSAVLGTPLYISPEQLALQPLDARSDQFSFCVALYAALYGSHPYAEPAPPTRESQALTHSRGAVGTHRVGPPSMLSLVTGLVEGRLRRPRKIVVSGRVYRALARGLARDPADRYPSMTALLAELGRDPLRKFGPWLGIASVGAMLGAGAFIPGAISECKNIEAEFKDAWTPARAEAVERAFLATGSEHAAPAARHVQQTLDAYRTQWLAARADNCEATRDRAAQELEVDRRRATCLDHARDTLAATVELLTGADATTVETAAEALALLPALESCSAGFQRRQTCLDAADDPRLRGRLDRARALEISGNFSEAEAIAAAVLDEAREHPRLAAEAHLLRGRVFAEQSRGPAASEAFEAAYLLAEAAGCEALGFEAATRSTKLIALNFDLPAERGRIWSFVAGSKLQRLPESARLNAELHSDLGLLLQHREDLAGGRARNLAEAEAQHQIALELRQRLAGTGSTLELAFSYLNLGDLARIHEDFELARKLSQRALDAYTEVLGEDHPTLWKPHYNLGLALQGLERLPEARLALERARTLASAGLGPEHRTVGMITYALAITVDDEDHDRALALGLAAQAIYAREVADDDPVRVEPLMLLGQLYTDREQPEQALPYREEVVGRQRHADPGDRANGHFELGVTLRELGRLDEALNQVERAEASLAALERAPDDLVAEIRTLKTEILSSINPAKTR